MQDISFECSQCGGKSEPVWFVEHEQVKLIPTGRRRKAVSHFECQSCGKKDCVDDTFDGPWIAR